MGYHFNQLESWFLSFCQERKIVKIIETVNEVHNLNSTILPLHTVIKETVNKTEVKFNRQGKFRYWFKELHSISSRPQNVKSLSELCSEALAYTCATTKMLDAQFAGSSKSILNLSAHFLGLLKNSSVVVAFNPLYRKNKIVCTISENEKVTDFSWSHHCQSTMLLLKKRHFISVLNVFTSNESFASRCPTPVCCISSTKHNPSLILTSGKNFHVWDTRQEGPAASCSLVQAPCSGNSKLAAKSCCFMDRNYNEIICVDKSGEGRLGVLDRRKFNEFSFSTDIKCKSIFSVEENVNRTVILVQSVSGKIRLLDYTSLSAIQSGFYGQPQCSPVRGLTVCDDLFVQCSDKVALFSTTFHQPLVSVPRLPGAGSVMSTAFLEKSSNLLCSTATAAFTVRFH